VQCFRSCLLSSSPSCHSVTLHSLLKKDSYYRVTCAYFLPTFSIVLSPHSHPLDGKTPLCIEQAVFVAYVQNPCPPHVLWGCFHAATQGGHREKKGKVEEGKGTVSPQMLQKHIAIWVLSQGLGAARGKNGSQSSVSRCGKGNYLHQCTCNSEIAQLCKQGRRIQMCSDG